MLVNVKLFLNMRGCVFQFVVCHYMLFVGVTIQMGVRSECCVTRRILGNNFLMYNILRGSHVDNETQFNALLA